MVLMQLTISEDSLLYLFFDCSIVKDIVKDSKQAYKSSSQISQRRTRQNQIDGKVAI